MLDAEGVDEPGDEKDAANRMKPCWRRPSSLGHGHKYQRQRNKFNEIPVPPDALRQRGIAAIEQRDAGFGAQRDQLVPALGRAWVGRSVVHKATMSAALPYFASAAACTLSINATSSLLRS